MRSEYDYDWLVGSYRKNLYTEESARAMVVREMQCKGVHHRIERIAPVGDFGDADLARVWIFRVWLTPEAD